MFCITVSASTVHKRLHHFTPPAHVTTTPFIFATHKNFSLLTTRCNWSLHLLYLLHISFLCFYHFKCHQCEFKYYLERKKKSKKKKKKAGSQLCPATFYKGLQFKISNTNQINKINKNTQKDIFYSVSSHPDTKTICARGIRS